MFYRDSIKGIMITKMERQKSNSSNITLSDFSQFGDSLFDPIEVEKIVANNDLFATSFGDDAIPHPADDENENISVIGRRSRSDSFQSISLLELWVDLEDLSSKLSLPQKSTSHSRRSSITGVSSLSGGLNDFPFDTLDTYGMMDDDIDAVMETLTCDPPIHMVHSINQGPKDAIELADQTMCKLIFDFRSAKNRLINSSKATHYGCTLIPDAVASRSNGTVDNVLLPVDSSVSELPKSVPPSVNPAKCTIKPKTKNCNRYYNRVQKNKVYFKPTELDVKLGRGGHVNGHIGNQMYLEKKMEIQDRYLAASKEEKTDISQELVDAVHAWGGRFLKEDKEVGWFEVTNIIARKKASQTLREHEDRAKKKKPREQFDGGT
jgi:hypothetical protein